MSAGDRILDLRDAIIALLGFVQHRANCAGSRRCDCGYDRAVRTAMQAAKVDPARTGRPNLPRALAPLVVLLAIACGGSSRLPAPARPNPRPTPVVVRDTVRDTLHLADTVRSTITLADTVRGPQVVLPGDTLRLPAVTVPPDTTRLPAVVLPADTVRPPVVVIPSDTVRAPTVTLPADTVQLPDVVLPADTVRTPTVTLPPDTVQPPPLVLPDPAALPVDTTPKAREPDAPLDTTKVLRILDLAGHYGEGNVYLGAVHVGRVIQGHSAAEWFAYRPGVSATGASLLRDPLPYPGKAAAMRALATVPSRLAFH